MNPQGLLGIAVILAVAWAASEDRGRISWRLVAAGLALQLALALLLIKVPLFRDAFLALNDAVLALQRASEAGTSFVFAYLGGGPLPFEQTQPGASFVLAFRALPLILVVSALSALLFYWRVLPAIVRAFAWALGRTLGVGGALGHGTAANIFVGMVEAPILIRPYIKDLGRGELFALMTCGMATIAGTVMVLYASILAAVVPDAMGHILTASLISAPAALLVAGLMVPGSGEKTAGGLAPDGSAASAMDAVTTGTAQGVTLLINVIAMLVVLVALVALANLILALAPEVGGAALTFQRLLGWALTPLAWLIGVPWAEAATAGALLGTKVILNELIAYLDMAALPAEALSPRSRLILTYAMCGFANLGSLGIMIGGLATLAPERRGVIVALGMKSVAAGVLATAMTGALVGLLT